MPAHRWMLSVLAVLVLWPAAAHGQSPELMAAYRQSGELYAQGRYEEVLPFAEKAMRLAEHEFGPNHPTTATLINNLGEVHRAQGGYAEAEQLHKQALTIREKALGPGHPDVAQSLDNLGQLYHAQVHYA